MSIENSLKKLNIVLPNAPEPVGATVVNVEFLIPYFWILFFIFFGSPWINLLFEKPSQSKSHIILLP